MEKYKNFIEDLSKLLKSKGDNIAKYNEGYDSLTLMFDYETFKVLDNEKSKLFKDFRDLVYKHEFSYDFICYRVIEVYEE